MLFRNLFSIFNFDKLGLNKENDPIKFYFTCKLYSRLLKQHISDELKENFKDMNIVTCDLINNFYKCCDEMKDKWNFDLIKCTECVSIEKLLVETKCSDCLSKTKMLVLPIPLPPVIMENIGIFSHLKEIFDFSRSYISYTGTYYYIFIYM